MEWVLGERKLIVWCMWVHLEIVIGNTRPFFKSVEVPLDHMFKSFVWALKVTFPWATYSDFIRHFLGLNSSLSWILAFVNF